MNNMHGAGMAVEDLRREADVLATPLPHSYFGVIKKTAKGRKAGRVWQSKQTPTLKVKVWLIRHCTVSTELKLI